MSELKTKVNEGSVEDFLNSVDDEQKRADSKTLLDIFTKATGEPAKMWGTAIVGFGQYHYVYESGREGDWMLTGFSPRKAALTLYLTTGYPMREALLAKLGTYKTGKGCLYIMKLADIDEAVLRELIATSFHEMKQRNSTDLQHGE